VKRPDWLSRRAQRTFRVKIGDDAWEVLVTWALEVDMKPEEVATLILERTLLVEGAGQARKT